MKTTTKGIIVVAASIALIILFGVFSRFSLVVFVILGVGLYLIVKGMRSRTPSLNV